MPAPHRPGLTVDSGLTIPESELSWRFSRSSGPGGQGVNTADSRVELVWDVAGLFVRLTRLLRSAADVLAVGVVLQRVVPGAAGLR